ncbi:MAG: hypothetical protein QXP61_04575 [Nitrososphaerales archaeon]
MIVARRANRLKGKKPTSTIARAHPKSPSVRTTIPHEITEMLEWDVGDILSWTIEKDDNRYYVKVRRLE